VDIPEEGKGKGKERREVGEGDDTVTIEDMFDKEDGDMLQEWFDLRSKFSSPGLPNVPFIDDPPTSLEASLPAPPKRPRNVAHNRITKTLKVTESTSQEVSSSSRVVEYLSCSIVYADNLILGSRRRFHHPTPLTKGKETTGRHWASWLREAAAQPPL
jgi:hypothetical protein